MNSPLPDYLDEEIRRSLSLENRKPFDGDSNAPYRTIIEFAEVGECGGDPAGFWCKVRVPRQVDNSLGGTVFETFNDRTEAAAVLRYLADLLES